VENIQKELPKFQGVEIPANSSQSHLKCAIQVCVSMLNIKVHISTFRKRLGGGGMMIWACFAATGPGHLAVIKSSMNSSVYQSILESNVRPSVQQLKLG